MTFYKKSSLHIFLTLFLVSNICAFQNPIFYCLKWLSYKQLIQTLKHEDACAIRTKLNNYDHPINNHEMDEILHIFCAQRKTELLFQNELPRILLICIEKGIVNSQIINCIFDNYIPNRAYLLEVLHNKGYKLSEKLLKKACKNRKTDLIVILLELGIGINYRSKNGNTPLHSVARYGNSDMNRILEDFFKHNADITAINNEGNTFLHVAGKYNMLHGHYDDIIKIVSTHFPHHSIHEYKNSSGYIAANLVTKYHPSQSSGSTRRKDGLDALQFITAGILLLGLL